MLAHSMAKALNLEEPKPYRMPKAEIENVDLGNVETLDLDLISRLVFSVYDVRRDSFKFKNAFTDGKSFDAMRQNYRERRELSSVTIKMLLKNQKHLVFIRLCSCLNFLKQFVLSIFVQTALNLREFFFCSLLRVISPSW